MTRRVRSTRFAVAAAVVFQVVLQVALGGVLQDELHLRLGFQVSQQRQNVGVLETVCG